IECTTFEVDPLGNVDWDSYKKCFRKNTKLVIANHASNVIGVISPIHKIASIAHSHGAMILLDCTQTIGYIPIDLQDSKIDFVAGTGHKTLFGPSGVGFLYVKNPHEVESLIE